MADSEPTNQGPHVEAQKHLPDNLREFVPYGLGFVVFFAVGMSPFLGTVEIPGFKALLTLMPENLRDTAIPISAFIMGLIGASIQHYAMSKPTQAWLKRQFSNAWKLALGSVASLIVIYTFVIVPFEVVQPERGTIYVQVGFYRPQNPLCPPDVSDATCLARVTIDRARIDGHWGDVNVRCAALTLQAAYWASTGFLVWLIGVLYMRRLSTRATP